MEFYEILSERYDDLFPLEPEILAFLRESFRGARSVLDAACGTGTYAEALAEGGRRVVGIDLDGRMIAKAKAKSAGMKDGRFPEYRVGDMLKLKDGFGPEFEGLACIGNSVVHLGSRDSVRAAFEGFHAVLARKGRLVVQIVNFDRVAARGIRELPTLRGGGAELVRRYLPSGEEGRLVFETELVVSRPGGEEFRSTQSIPLLALSSGELVGYAESAGFRGIELFGSYGRAQYVADESFLTVLAAVKP